MSVLRRTSRPTGAGSWAVRWTVDGTVVAEMEVFANNPQTMQMVVADFPGWAAETAGVKGIIPAAGAVLDHLPRLNGANS